MALTIVHSSDIHIGRRGNEERDSGVEALRAVGRVCERERADLLIIAGDLFDHNRVGPALLNEVEQALAALPIPVILTPGNHDALEPGSVLTRLDLGDRPDRHLITSEDGETVPYPGLDLIIWGRALVDHHPGYRPAQGVPARDGARWYVGIAHGHYLPPPDHSGLFTRPGWVPPRSSPIFHDEIGESQLDYLALGHWHVPTNVSHGRTTAWYCGSPDPTDCQPAGHAAVVRLGDAGTTVTIAPLKDLIPERALAVR